MTSQEESIQQVDIDTNIAELKDQFFFHELIRENKSRKHYIVEDLTIEIDDSTEESNTILTNKQNFDKTVRYYQKIINYCQSQFAKNDIITYRQLFQYEDPEKNIYEVVSVCDFGESERIDVENIEKEHINKFLKNVCVLLLDLQKFDNIYHGNIFLKNIVLDNEELKLSGFQPILKDDETELLWKRQFIEKFGIERFDLYLMGLLWLKFLNTPIEKYTDKNISLQEFHSHVNNISKDLTKEQKMETVAKLIDLENCLNIDLDTVILNFDQYFIIQKIQIEQNDGSNNYESQDRKSNVFKKSMENDEVFTLKSPIQNFESGKQDSKNLITIEGNFTLQENQSVGYKLSNPESNTNLIKQNTVNLPERRSIDPYIDKQKDIINMVNSQRRLKQGYVNSLDNINPDFSIDRKNEDEEPQINYLSSKFQHNSDEDININEEENSLEKTKIDDDQKVETKITYNNDGSKTETRTVTTTIHRQSTTKSSSTHRNSKSSLNKNSSSNKLQNNSDSTQRFQQIEGQINQDASDSQKELEKQQQIQAAKERAIKKQKKLQKQLEEQKKKEQEYLERKEKARKVRYNFKKKNDQSQDQINVQNLKQQEEEDSEEEKVVFGQIIKKKPKPNPELEAIIQKEIEEKKKQLEEKLRLEREEMKQKALKKQQEEKAMKDKIRRIAEMKRKKKKKQKKIMNESSDNLNKSRNVNNNRSMIKSKNNKSKSQIKNNKNQLDTNYQDFIQDKIIKEQKPIKPSKSQKKVKGKLQLEKNSKKYHNVSIDDLNKKIKKQMDISDYQHRAQMFEYDSNNFRNKKIPFKKIFDKAKGNQYFKEERPKIQKNQSQKQKQNEAIYSPKVDDSFKNIEIGNDDDYYKKKIFQHESNKKDSQRQSFNKQELDQIYQEQEQQYQQSSARKIDQLLSKKRSHKSKPVQVQTYNEPQIIEKQVTNKLSQRDIDIAYPQVHDSQFESIQIFDTQKTNESKQIRKASIPNKEQQYYDENEGVYRSHYTDKFQDLNEEIEDEEVLNSSIEQKQEQIEEQQQQNPYDDFNTNEQIDIQNYHVEKPSQEETQQQIKQPENSEKIIDYNTNELNAIFNPKTNAKYGKKWKEQNQKQPKKKVEDQFKEIIPQQKVSNLIKKKNKEEGISKIETLKNLSILHFSKKNYNKSSQYLQEAIDILQKTKIKSKDSMINKLKFSIIINNIEEKDYDQAYQIIQSINENLQLPPKYNIVKGDVLSKLQKNEEAFKSYILELNYILEENLTHDQNKQLFFIILIKIIHVLLYFEEAEIVKFFNYILDILEQQIENGVDEEQIHQIKVDFMMNLMNILLENKYFDLLNYFLNIIAQKKLINLDYLTDNQKYIISKIYMQFSFYLKSIPNYGNQKEIYVNFLNHALFLIKQIKKTNIQVYNKMIELLLFKGIFFIKEKAYKLAINHLIQAYDLFQTDIKNQIPTKIYYTILFNLGLSYFCQKNFKEALYYLEQINNSSCQELEILEKAQKLLCKVYYILGLNQRCCQQMKPFIQKIMNNKKPNEEDLKYLSIYFLCASQCNEQEHENILQYLIQKIKNDKYLLNKKYFFLFYNIYIIMKNDNKLEESEYFLSQLRKIMKQEGEDEKAESFLVLINLMFTKYLLNKNDEAFKLNSKVIKGMQDKNKNIAQNSKEIENYLYNFLLLIIGKLDDTQGGNLDKLKSEMIDQIKEFKENNKIYDKIYEILKKDNFKTSVLSFSVRSINSSTFDSRKQTQKILDFQNQFYKQTIKQNQVEQPVIKPITKTKKKRFTKKKRLKSSDLIRTSNYFKKPKCSCYQLNFNKNDLLKLIIEFFQQIKNMLFLNLTDKIDEYFLKFEQVINQKKINLEKFIYVKKLVRFYLEHKNKQLDEKLLYKLMQTVIENPDLCIHDIDFIITLLESFQNPLYLETFISYINKEHKNLSKVVFNELFMKSFYKKFNGMIKNLYEIFQHQKHDKIDNFPFIHYLNSQQILNIEKKLTFQFYFRLRDKLMNKNEFFAFFNQYIEKEKLVEFYYDYQIYVALVQRIRNQRDCFNLIQEFIQRFIEVSEFSELKNINSEYYIYKFLLLVKTMNFNEETSTSKDTSDKIIDFLNFLSQKIEKNQMYHFSVSSSFIGNIFFKNKLFESSIKAKSIAFESLKNVKITEPHFPLWFQKVDSKNLMKNILSFMIQNQLSLEKNDYAEKFLQKLLMIPPDNIADDLDNEIAQFLYYINTRDIKTAHQNLTNIQQKFQKAKLSILDKKLYQALIENLKLEILQTQKDENAYQHQRRKSKQSVDQLYNHLIEQ